MIGRPPHGVSRQWEMVVRYGIRRATGASCKGVRCPPIFSLSNLINAGWLVRMCINIHIAPLIAGTNRKAYLLHASFALKDSHCQ